MQTFYEENGILKIEELEFIKIDKSDPQFYQGDTLEEGFLFKASNATFRASTADIESYIKDGAKTIADVREKYSREGITILTKSEYEERFEKNRMDAHGSFE